MYIWREVRAAGRVGFGQTFGRQSRVGSGHRFAGSGPRKVTCGQTTLRLNSRSQFLFYRVILFFMLKFPNFRIKSAKIVRGNNFE